MLSAVGAGVGTGAGVTALIWAAGDAPLPPELPQAERASRARVRIVIQMIFFFMDHTSGFQ
jgi:hypothetical protein